MLTRIWDHLPQKSSRQDLEVDAGPKKVASSSRVILRLDTVNARTGTRKNERSLLQGQGDKHLKGRALRISRSAGSIFKPGKQGGGSRSCAIIRNPGRRLEPQRRLVWQERPRALIHILRGISSGREEGSRLATARQSLLQQ